MIWTHQLINTLIKLQSSRSNHLSMTANTTEKSSLQHTRLEGDSPYQTHNKFCTQSGWDQNSDFDTVLNAMGPCYVRDCIATLWRWTSPGPVKSSKQGCALEGFPLPSAHQPLLRKLPTHDPSVPHLPAPQCAFLFCRKQFALSQSQWTCLEKFAPKETFKDLLMYFWAAWTTQINSTVCSKGL